MDILPDIAFKYSAVYVFLSLAHFEFVKAKTVVSDFLDFAHSSCVVYMVHLYYC